MASSFSSSSTCASMVKLLSPRVFVNFRGDELRDNFISHLEKALKEDDIHYFLDNQLDPSEDLETLFQEIEDSKIALAVFSKRYSESKWCLNELVKIMENVEENKLRVIPIFFKVTVEDVKDQRGEFGVNLYGNQHTDRSNMPKWEKALKSAPAKVGLNWATYRNERDFIVDIVRAVKKVLAKIPPVSQGGKETNMISTKISSVSCSRNTTISGTIEQTSTELPLYGIEQRLKQLEDKLFDFKWPESRIVGIVGIPGIGKTTLATKYYNTWNHKVVVYKTILSIREKSITHGTHWLKNTLLNGQDFNEEADMFRKKILYVLDDVSHKDQVNFLYTKRGWIKGGSKIVITTRDKSSIEELVDDIYVVPCLNDKEALHLFNSHAFNDETSSAAGNFPNLSKGFVEYAEGIPRALEELGKEICGREEAHWETRLEKLPHCLNQNILTDLRISYDNLTCQEKDAFLDIACFFRSEEEDYVKCLLDGSESGEAVRDLTEKYLICISAGRIEMHNLLCTFGKELASSDTNKSGERMWNHEKAIEVLCSEHVREGTYKVRGIFLDTSKVMSKGIPLHRNTFIERFDHLNLRYLKVFDSLCPQQCFDCKVNLPDGLEFPFQEIRYLHWLKFPLGKLPPDFNPKNLIDLRLPYSEINRVWETAKEAPRLKWVDLSYSTKLIDLSALSKATDLQSINLEGCTNLGKLPIEMKKMKSLVFMNLRGCVMLSSLPAKLDLISLNTLILSGCSNFNKFELGSKNLEFLHLDGTAIKNLPATIQNFKKLVLLNLKDCKLLESLPYCLDKLKALEDLILSGCVKLTRFPDIKEKMENLQVLLLDGTSIQEVPNILLHCSKLKDQLVCQQPLRMNGVSLLRRLCLSGNHTIRSLGSDISQLYHLKWIDLKDCEKLESISTLPPNLQCLDAHDCISLKTVASPLALLIPTTQQVPSSFIFTNCEKLEHVAKNEIICCAHNKSRLLSEALNRRSKGFASEALVATSFPGSEIPAWFSHRASGAELELELPRHWSEKGFVGIALCAIVSFQDHKTRNNKPQVKCKCVFNNVETSPTNFDCHIGGLSETGDEERTIKSTHVFIGYTNWLNIKKRQEDDSMKGCVSTKGSIKFELTDCTNEIMNCEILKCGFSLVYESGSWEARSRIENVRQGGSILLGILRGIKWFFKLLSYGATATREDNFNCKASCNK